MYHYHLAPEELRARALDHLFQDMNVIPKDDLNAKRAFAGLPPLIKGYLRLGAYIGDGAIIDPQFNTVDVCIILPRQMIADRYRKHYERGYDQPLNATSDDLSE